MSIEKILWMGDIKPWMNESFILNSFNYYNIHPLSVKMIYDKQTNELKNFCFLNFENLEEANKCLIKLNGKKIPNTNFKFKLNWANYFSNFNKSVYVGNLNKDVDDICLYNLFKKKYPSVLHASVITDQGKSKGFGFILFSDEKEYEKCLNEMNGIKFHGNIIKVNEQRKKDENSQNKKNCNNENYDNNENIIYNLIDNQNIFHKIRNNNSKEQYLLNNIFDLSSNNIIDSNSIYNTNRNKNILNINNYQSIQHINIYDINVINNSSNMKNLEKINNINRIKNKNNKNFINNINYKNDINNKYEKDIIMKNNLSKIKNANNFINKNEIINISKKPKNIKNYDNLILNNGFNSQLVDDIKYNNNNFNNSNENINENNKKAHIQDFKLENFSNYDNSSLIKKLRINLDKMYKFYAEVFSSDRNKLNCKLILLIHFLIFL